MNQDRKYLWYSDTHLSLAWPFSVDRLIKHINKETPVGVLITGDISTGPSLKSHLTQLAKAVSCPIYFVLGNHDYHRRTFEGVNDDIRWVCKTYSHMHWMTDSGIISLGKDVALIGTEGWYDARLGDPKLMRYTFDWLLIHDLFFMDDMNQRIEYFRLLAEKSAELISNNLETSLKTHNRVYVMTHFPPWAEAADAHGKLLEKLWLPYNTNRCLGLAIEKVMLLQEKKRCTILAGHTHTPTNIFITKNIECLVAGANQFGFFGSVVKIYV